MIPSETIAYAFGTGGVVSALGAFYKVRTMTPVEKDSVIVTGAEMTVQAALAVASAETARADRAEAAVRERDAQIEALLARVDVLQQALDGVREELYAIKQSHDKNRSV